VTRRRWVTKVHKADEEVEGLLKKKKLYGRLFQTLPEMPVNGLPLAPALGDGDALISSSRSGVESAGLAGGGAA